MLIFNNLNIRINLVVNKSNIEGASKCVIILHIVRSICAEIVLAMRNL
jgi:hypothetical protein